ncbi:MAG: hypothetical protein AAGK22_08130 [Acidobacteriota bacterium]
MSSLTPRSALAAALAAALVLLGALALFAELPRVSQRPLPEETNAAGQWKLGGEQSRRLEASLLEIAEIVPEGSLVAVEAEAMSPPDFFFFSMWVSYYLPRQTVLRRSVVRPRHRSDEGNFLVRWPAQSGGLLETGALSLHELTDLRGPAARGQ